MALVVVDGATATPLPDAPSKVIAFVAAPLFVTIAVSGSKLTVGGKGVALESDILSSFSGHALTLVGTFAGGLAGSAVFDDLTLGGLATKTTRGGTVVVLFNSTFTITYKIVTPPVIPPSTPDPAFPVDTVFSVLCSFTTAGQAKLTSV